MRQILCVCFILLVTTSPIHSWDFFGLFKKSDPTTTPAPTTTTTTPPTTTQRARVATGACWWTQCGTRCTATAQVHDFNNVNCNPGQYKFRCCSQ